MPVGPVAIGLVAVATALFFWLRGGGADLPEPPDPDLAGMEDRVADAVRRARNGVLDDRDSPDRWAALGAAFLAHELHREGGRRLRPPPPPSTTGTTAGRTS